MRKQIDPMVILRKWNEKINFEITPSQSAIKFRNIGEEKLTWRLLFYLVYHFIKMKIMGKW